MTAADQRARDAMEHIEGFRESAFVHEWTAPNIILMIDNRVALHARAAVPEGDQSRVLKRVAFSTGGKS
jgi:alpha-ketoglutarate-dependent taurine dioxygenase